MGAILNNEFARNKPYMKLFVRIMRVGHIIENNVTEILKDFGITHIQFNILRCLENVHPKALAVGEIKDQLIFPASDVTRLLDRLVKNGFIERSECPKNRRKVDVSITPRGLTLIQDVLPLMNKKFNGYFENIINENERDLMIGYLGRIQNQYLNTSNQ